MFVVEYKPVQQANCHNFPAVQFQQFVEGEFISRLVKFEEQYIFFDFFNIYGICHLLYNSTMQTSQLL